MPLRCLNATLTQIKASHILFQTSFFPRDEKQTIVQQVCKCP